MVFTSSKKTAEVYDSYSGQLEKEIRPFSGGLRLAQYSEDGSKLAVMTDDHKIKLWHTKKPGGK